MGLRPIGKPEERLGWKRTFALAVGAGLGVLITAGLIHAARKGKGRGRE